jgi:hypothetical protein
MTNYIPSYLIWSMYYCIGVVFVVPKVFTTKTNVNKKIKKMEKISPLSGTLGSTSLCDSHHSKISQY